MIPALQPIPDADDLLTHLRSFCLPWRALTIAIDGRNGAGKTSVARYLAWQLGMPVLETDLWMLKMSPVTHRTGELKRLIRSRHRRDRPVIVEGVMMLRTLELIGVQPDYFVFVTNVTQESESEDDDSDIGPPPGLFGEVDAYAQALPPGRNRWLARSVRSGHCRPGRFARCLSR
jgi:hypothetical protein